MTYSVREASLDDLDRIVELTRAKRAKLAEWSPTWWNPATNADELHPFWIKHILEAAEPVVRVAVDGKTVVGCAASMPQPTQWLIDDVAFDDSPGHEIGKVIFGAIAEQPALICIATLDEAQVRSAIEAGLTHVSRYWIRRTPPPGPAENHQPLPAGHTLPTPPPHSFAGPFDPHTDGALSILTPDGGIVVGTPPMTAPPVYDSGGTVCVIDRIHGHDRATLLELALVHSANRGDAVVAVVVAAGDHELEWTLTESGFDRTVDIYQWP